MTNINQNLLKLKSHQFFQAIALHQGFIWACTIPGCNCNINTPFSPYSLYPYQIKRKHYEFLCSLQPLWNKLFVKLSQDKKFINNLHKQTKYYNEMIRNLLKIANLTFDDPLTQKKGFFISRSDYMIDKIKNKPLQIQINFMCVGQLTIADKIQDIHKVLTMIQDTQDNIISAQSFKPIFNQLVELYNWYEKYEHPLKKIAVLIVAKGNSSDRFQQIKIQTQFLKNKIKVIKYCFTQLINHINFDKENHKIEIDGYQIAVVFYRHGAFEQDYPSEKEYFVRQQLELSRAIKIPNVTIQLLNFKNFQTMINSNDVLTHYLSKNETEYILSSQVRFFTPEEIRKNKEIIIKQYGNNLVVKSIHEGKSVYLKEKAIKYLKRRLHKHNTYGIY